MRHQIRYFVVGLFLASAVLTFSGANKAQEVNANGVCGYIRISEMECHLPGSPDDVENYTPIGTMNMYTEDGSTIVGTFNFN